MPDLTPGWRAASHAVAEQVIRDAARGLYADAAIRVLAALDEPQPAVPAVESGTCTATFYDGWIGRETVTCTQPAGHYDGSVPIRDSDVNGPTDPGGWHFATYPNGDRVAWCDLARGASPHSPAPTATDPTEQPA